jgi:hypothetical protein
VVVLNAGWAFDSGNGDRKVLAAVQADQPVPAPSDTYNGSGNPAGSNPGVGGNAWFIDNEVQHLGNGTYIAAAQRDALIRSNAAICEHMGWNPATRLIGHREWTTRKVDPRWGGFANPMPLIRQDTQGAMNMPLTDDDIQKIAKAVVSYPGGSSVDNTPLLTLISGTYRLARATEAAVAALDIEGVSEAELDLRVARLLDVLPTRTIDALKAAL